MNMKLQFTPDSATFFTTPNGHICNLLSANITNKIGMYVIFKKC